MTFYFIALHNPEETMLRTTLDTNFITKLIFTDIQYFHLTKGNNKFPSHKNDTKCTKMDYTYEINTAKFAENTYTHLWGNFIVDLFDSKYMSKNELNI